MSSVSEQRRNKQYIWSVTVIQPSEDQVQQVAKQLAPDVIRVRFNIGTDWSGDPAVYFRILLADDASRRERLAEVTGRIGATIFEELGLANLDLIPYCNFRSESEQAEMQDEARA